MGVPEVLLVLVGVVVGGALGYIVALLRARSAAEAEIRAQQDAVADAKSQRELAEQLRTETDRLRKETERLQGELTQEKAQSGVLTGQLDGVKRLEREVETLRAEIDSTDRELRAAQSANAALKEELAGKDREYAGRLETLQESQRTLEEKLRVLGQDLVNSAQKSFLAQATEHLGRLAEGNQQDYAKRQKGIEELLSPVKQELERLEKLNREMDEKNSRQDQTLLNLLQGLQDSTDGLRKALSRPEVRGSYGEKQLITILDGAGLVEGVHYDTQISETTEEGRLRPDVIIRLPKGRNIIVDVKTPLYHFQEYHNATDDAGRDAARAAFMDAFRKHIRSLGSKRYQDLGLANTPDFVIMFVPIEAMYYLAMTTDRTIHLFAEQQGVTVCNPMNMVALVRSVSFVLDQERIGAEAEEIKKVGETLYARVLKLIEHSSSLGNKLDATVRAFNDMIGSVDQNLVPSAVKMRQLGVGKASEPKALVTVDSRPRHSRHALTASTENEGPAALEPPMALDLEP